MNKNESKKKSRWNGPGYSEMIQTRKISNERL